MENKPKNNHTILRKITGILLIAVGIVGLFVPLIQGIALIATGAILLGWNGLGKWWKTFKAWLARPKR